jgi:hypothetical protein
MWSLNDGCPKPLFFPNHKEGCGEKAHWTQGLQIPPNTLPHGYDGIVIVQKQ